jgi:hypothetical protein
MRTKLATAKRKNHGTKIKKQARIRRNETGPTTQELLAYINLSAAKSTSARDADGP